MDAPFRSHARLFEECRFAQERAKLFRPVVTTDQTGEAAQPDAVASGQNDGPAMRQARSFGGVRGSMFTNFPCGAPGELRCFHQAQFCLGSDLQPLGHCFGRGYLKHAFI